MMRVALVGLTLALVGLGTWQLLRHGQRTAMVDARRELAAAPPAALADVAPARVVGTCVRDAVGAVLPAPPRRMRSGFRLVVPCQWPDIGRVLVDVGWTDNPAAAMASLPEQLAVDGISEPFPQPSGWSPQRHAEGMMRYGNAMDAATAFDARLAYVLQGPAVEDDQLAPFDAALTPGWAIHPPHRPHLGYAGFWFTCAVLLVVQVLRKPAANPETQTPPKRS